MPRAASLSRLALLLAILLGSGAGCSTKKGPAAAEAPGAAALACVEAIERAAGADRLARLELLAAGCHPPCGPIADVLLPEEGGLTRIVEATAACGGFCTKSVRDVFRGDAPGNRWRKLAETCPHSFAVDDGARRYVGAPWFFLGRIAGWLAEARPGLDAAGQARLDAALAALRLPLPLVSSIGTGFEVPEAGAASSGSPDASTAVAPGAPVEYAVVTPGRITIGVAAWAQLDAGRVELLPGPGRPFPGAEAPVDGLATALSGLRSLATAAGAGDRASAGAKTGDLDAPLLIAPRAMPAQRLLEVLWRSGLRGRLAVAGPLPRGHRVALVSGGPDEAAAPTAATSSPSATTSPPPSFTLMAPTGPRPLADGAAISDLAALLDQAAADGITELRVVSGPPAAPTPVQ